VNKKAELAAKERAKIEAAVAKERAKAETELAEKAKKVEEEAEQAARAELDEGIVKLVILPSTDPDQIRELEERLRQVQNLRLVLLGGSIEEGSKIIVAAEKPIPLVRVLREIPLVEQVVKTDKEIQITLKVKE
jgi:hypothetical protein